MAEKKEEIKEKVVETREPIKEKSSKKSELNKYPTLQLKSERDIAMDFAEKVYQRFDKMIKSVVLFGSQAKHTAVSGSDIDIIIILDDASIKFDDQLTLWYREELGKIVSENPYKQELHINTVKLTTWWNDLTKGDPTVVNILRYGETLIDLGGFFNPLKILLDQGKIKPTPESIYNALNRVPGHIRNSKFAEISSIEGCYWAFVDCAQALLMAIRVLPPSPEHISILLKENFVDKKLLDMKHVINFIEVYELHKKVMHGGLNDIDGKLIDSHQDKAEDFFKATIKLIDEII
ncbi:MAG: nucleotidyltransferase domain-containing protein [Nanoarchaeota archaeon]